MLLSKKVLLGQRRRYGYAFLYLPPISKEVTSCVCAFVRVLVFLKKNRAPGHQACLWLESNGYGKLCGGTSGRTRLVFPRDDTLFIFPELQGHTISSNQHEPCPTVMYELFG
jgi:hypothetical protein